MWQRSGLATRWARASAAGGPSGAVADRDLDAVVALFDAAAGFVDRLPSADVRGVRRPPLRPGAARRHRRRPRGGGGDGAAAHRARVQGPGVGPRVRRRRAGGRVARPARARRRCSAPRSSSNGPPASTAPASTGARSPSPRSGGCSTSPAPGPAAGSWSPPSRARSTAPTPARRRPGSSTWSRAAARGRPAAHRAAPLADAARAGGRPAPRAHRSAHRRRTRRSAAASVLRRLADEGVPGAAPVALVGAGAAVRRRPAGARRAAVRVRPSAIETFQRCPLRWVLSAVGAEASPDTTRTVGTAVHAVAQQVAEGLPPADAPAALAAELDQLDLGPGWSDQRQRQSAQDMLDRLPRLARGRRPRAGRRRGRVRRHRRPGAHPRARSTGWSATPTAGWSSSTSRPGKTPAKNTEEHGQLAAYQVAVAAGRLRRPRHACPAARRCCRSARAPRPRSSTRSRCPPTSPWPRPGPASCSPRSARAWARRPSRCAPARTARGARPGAAARCRSPAGR